MYVMVYSSYTHCSVSWFSEKTLLFRCGTEETLVCKIPCTRHYTVQDNTHIKAYHWYYLTESFNISIQADN